MAMISQYIRKARKDHICERCCKKIMKGERYHLSKWADDSIYNMKLCALCYYVWHNNLWDEDPWDEGFYPGELANYHSQVPQGYRLPERV